MKKATLIVSICTAIVLTGCKAHIPKSENLPGGEIQADVAIDVRGKTISTYILFRANQKLKDMQPGQILEITTDRHEAVNNDILAWARMTDHNLQKVVSHTHARRFYVQKSDKAPRQSRLSMIISDPALESLLTPLGLALGAALSGSEVHVIFQGPAVRVLEKDFKGSLKGLSKPFSAIARKGMAEIGHLPPQEKLKQLKSLGSYFYACGPSMDHFGIQKKNLIFEDIMVAEYMTFMEVMRTADMHVFLQ